MPEIDRDEDDAVLRERLRGLAPGAPRASAWPAMRAHLRARQRRRPVAAWIALAAAAALAAIALLPRLAAPPVVTAPQSAQAGPAAADADADAGIDAWIAQSQALEAALRGSPVAREPLGARAALASAEIEDLIAMLDLELSVTDDAVRSERLWRQRVALMEQLAEVRGEGRWRYALTENGAALMPASYRID